MKLTLKPDIISKFEPEKNRYGIYYEDIRTTVYLQLSEVKGSISISYNYTDHEESDYTKKVHYALKGFNQIQQFANIDIDDILQKYTQNIDAYLALIPEQTAQYCAVAYDESWIHECVKIINTLNINGLSYNIPTREDFLLNATICDSPNISIIYRNKTTAVKKEIERGHIKYVMPPLYEFDILRYSKYISIDNLIKSFVLKVNEYWNKQQSVKLKEDQRQSTIKNTILKYQTLFGNCSHEATERRYEFGARKYETYIIDSYYLTYNRIIDGVIETKKVKIAEDKNGLFIFGALTHLSSYEVIQILNILSLD